MKVYRITKAKYANLDGIGGLYVAGRWNMKGHRAIYSAESISLAAWEKLVHVTDYRDLPVDLVVVTIDVPDSIKIEEIPDNVLAPGWNEPLPYRSYKKETVMYGTEFLEQNKYLILKIPSAVISGEHNYLINPNHSDIHKCKIEKVVAFKFDERIKK